MRVKLVNLNGKYNISDGIELEVKELRKDGSICTKEYGYKQSIFTKDEYEEVLIKNEVSVNIMCGLITCIHNNGKRVCKNKNLELNYFDDYSIFKDENLPNTDMKITEYLGTHIGHFMGVQCRDFKMDEHKVMKKYWDIKEREI